LGFGVSSGLGTGGGAGAQPLPPPAQPPPPGLAAAAVAVAPGTGDALGAQQQHAQGQTRVGGGELAGRLTDEDRNRLSEEAFEADERREGAEFEVLQPAVVSIVTEAVKRGDVLRRTVGHMVSPFHGVKPPAIGIEKYVDRMFKYSGCSASVCVYSLVYLERFLASRPGFPVNSYDVHRLLISCVMVAAKFLDDIYYNNAYYGKIGGVPTAEMNKLELEVLFELRFNLTVPIEVCTRVRDAMAHGGTGQVWRMNAPPLSEAQQRLSAQDFPHLLERMTPLPLLGRANTPPATLGLPQKSASMAERPVQPGGGVYSRSRRTLASHSPSPTGDLGGAHPPVGGSGAHAGEPRGGTTDVAMDVASGPSGVVPADAAAAAAAAAATATATATAIATRVDDMEE